MLEITHKIVFQLVSYNKANTLRKILPNIDINAKDNTGQTLLHRAANRGRLNVVRFLIESGAHLNIKNNQGFTPLFYATFWSHIDIADLLKEHGAE